MWMAEQFVLLLATPLGGTRGGWNVFGVRAMKNIEMFGIFTCDFE